MKTLLLSLFAALSVSALAFESPEVILVTDPVQRNVVRLDPFTGRTMGTFGRNFLFNPGQIAISGDTAYVLDSGTVLSRFNLHTGSFLGATNLTVVGVRDMAFGADGLYLADGTNVRRINPVNGANLNVWSFDSQVNTVSISSATSRMIVGMQSGDSHVVNRATGSTLYTTTAVGAVTSSMVDPLGNLVTANTHPSDFVQYFSVRPDLTGFTFGGFASNLVRPSAVSLGAGHAGAYVLARNGSGDFQVTSLVPFEFGASAFFSMTNIGPTYSNGSDMAVYVAPEPGTMIALGAGLAAFVARRRSRRPRA